MISRLPPDWPADAVAAHRLQGLIVRTLVNAVSNLERERSIHRNLCGVSASGTGEPGIVQALHRLTGLPAVIEDRYGNPHAWAGPGRPDPYPKPPPQQRQEFLRQLTRRGSVVRVKDRLVALARTRDDAMLGVLALRERRHPTPDRQLNPRGHGGDPGTAGSLGGRPRVRCCEASLRIAATDFSTRSSGTRTRCGPRSA